MYLERYQLRFEGNRNFFFSEGPRGLVEKAILYRKFPGIDMYSLSFGGWDEKSDRIDDMAITNNGDTQKILATVAASVMFFMSQQPHATVFATGSTPSRTRLYQMGIRRHLLEISCKFEIEGFREGNWEMFRPGRGYEGFLIRGKSCNLVER